MRTARTWGASVQKGHRAFVPVTFIDTLGRDFAETRLEWASFDLLSGAVGAKINLSRSVLLTANLIVRLNSARLTAPIVPLIGLSWAF